MMIFQKFKLSIVSLALLLTGATVLLPAVANASFSTDACAGVNVVNGGAASDKCSTTAGTSIGNIIKLVINILSIIVGFAAVFMIVYSGFKYITSGGDSGKVSGAKGTIIYAIVGLIIVASAQVLVNFTLARTNASQTICTKTGQKNCTPAPKK